MALDIYARLVEKLPVQSGEGRNGPWNKQEFIVETIGDYPKKICFSCWNDKIDDLQNFDLNALIKVHFNLESREYNGRWYTDLRAWKLEFPETKDTKTSPSSENVSAETTETPNTTNDVDSQEENKEDDLPF